MQRGVITLMVLLLHGCGGGDGPTVKVLGPATLPLQAGEDAGTLTIALTPRAVVGGSVETAEAEVVYAMDAASGAVRIEAPDLGWSGVALRKGFAGDDGPVVVPFEREP
jgi:hypothetical protein